MNDYLTLDIKTFFLSKTRNVFLKNEIQLDGVYFVLLGNEKQAVTLSLR